MNGTTRCPRRSSAVMSEPLDDDLVIYDELSGKSYVLNMTGQRIWSLCDGTRTEATLAQAVAADFGIGYPRACGDVAELVAQLSDAKLLVD